jgi:hypothetical protein
VDLVRLLNSSKNELAIAANKKASRINKCADWLCFETQKIKYNKKRIINRIANPFNTVFLLPPGNSYPQIGHILLLDSISIAQEGHSFFMLIMQRNGKFRKD